MLCLPNTLRQKYFTKIRDAENMKMSTGFDIQHIYNKYKLLECISKTKNSFINGNSLSNRSTRKYYIDKGNNLNYSLKHHQHSNSDRKGVFTNKNENSFHDKKTLSKSESDQKILSKTQYNIFSFKIKSIDYNIASSFKRNKINLSNSTDNKNIRLKSISTHKRKNNSSNNKNNSDIIPPQIKQFYLKKTNSKSSISLFKSDLASNSKSNFSSYIKNQKQKNSKLSIKLKDKINSNNLSHNYYFHKTNMKILTQYGYKTQAGKKENNISKTNQDYILIRTSINNISDFNVFGVLDGHGENGHLASGFVGEYIYHKIIEFQPINKLTNHKDIYNKLKQNNFEIIKNAFISAETELKNENINYNDSGTTCCLVIQIGNNLICANTGDSRSILIKVMKHKNISSYVYMELSKDHKPFHEEERKRIEMNGGKVEQLVQNGKVYGPYRVWDKKGIYPGLAVSRTIGDLEASNLGVVPTPEIMEYCIDENCKYIVIASDGLWDVFDNKSVMKITKDYYEEGDPDKLCDVLVNKARLLWEKEDIVDDISVITAFF